MPHAPCATVRIHTCEAAHTRLLPVQFRTYKIIYRRYAGLFFAFCVDVNDNELSFLEGIHVFVEMLDKYFGNVCELDLVFNFHKVRGVCSALSFMRRAGCMFYATWLSLVLLRVCLLCRCTPSLMSTSSAASCKRPVSW